MKSPRNRGAAVAAGLVVIATLVVLGLTSCAGQQAAPGDAEEAASERTDQATSDVAMLEPTGEVGSMQLQGVWDGTLAVPGADIQIIVKFLDDPAAAGDGGSASATIDIPAQNAIGLPLSNVRATGADTGSEVHFELAVAGPSLVADGVIAADGTIAGTFTQGAASGEFSLERTADLTESDRQNWNAVAPTESHGRESDVSIESDGVTIRGTLLTPNEPAGPWPLVVIVAGSGPTDRDGNSPLISGRNDSLKLLAEGLAAHGIASVRYDKRGIAKSAYADFAEEDLTFADYADDVLLWTRWAAKRDDVSQIFLAGHSEGGLAVLAAAGAPEAPTAAPGVNFELAREENDEIAGVICIAAPGRTFDAIVLEQLARSLGEGSDLYDQARNIFAALREGRTVADVPRELLSLFRPSVQPYLQSIVRFDPAELAKAMPQPLLIIGGTEDLQVAPADADALANARPDARTVMIEGMNHVLKIVPAGDLAANQRAYGDPAFELSEELVVSVVNFILGR